MIRELNKKIETLESESKESQEELEKRNSLILELQKEKAQEKEGDHKLNQLWKAKIEQLKSEIEQKDAKINSLENHQSKSKGDSDSQLKELQAQIEQQNSKIKSLENEISKSKSKSDSDSQLKEKVRNLQANLDKVIFIFIYFNSFIHY